MDRFLAGGEPPDGDAPGLAEVPIADLLVQLEETIGQGAGAVVFAGEDDWAGTVLFEDGRVCWAVARDMGSRLTDLLCEQSEPPVDRRIVEHVYRRCKEEGRPLGEALVQSGVVSEQGLRQALRAHTVEALVAMAASPDRGAPRWMTRAEGRRYDARFTYALVELLVAAQTLGVSDLDSEVSAALHPELAGTCLWATFLRRDGAAALLLVAADGADDLSVGDVVELGRWAAAELDLTGAIDAGRRLVTIARATGETAVAWCAGALIHVATCQDTSALARLLGRLMRRAAAAEEPSGD